MASEPDSPLLPSDSDSDSEFSSSMSILLTPPSSSPVLDTAQAELHPYNGSATQNDPQEFASRPDPLPLTPGSFQAHPSTWLVMDQPRAVQSPTETPAQDNEADESRGQKRTSSEADLSAGPSAERNNAHQLTRNRPIIPIYHIQTAAAPLPTVQLKPVPKCYLDVRDYKPYLVIIEPFHLQEYNGNRPFSHAFQSKRSPEFLAYLDYVQQPLAQVEQQGKRSEHAMTYLRSIDHKKFFTVDLGNATYAIKVRHSVAALRIEAARQWRLIRALRTTWPRFHDLDSLRPVHPPHVPQPLMVVPPAGKGKFFGLLMEHTRPLSEGYSRFLMRKYLGPSFVSYFTPRPIWRSMTVCPRMGEMKPGLDWWNFGHHTLSSVPGYFDILCDEVPYSVRAWAAKMGGTLAILHWRCNLDAAGVIFYFGMGASSHPQLFLTDLSKCREFEASVQGVMTQLVPAVASSPQWPRPKNAPSFRHVEDNNNIVSIVWEGFCKAYQDASNRILEDDGTGSRFGMLPSVFVTQLEAKWTAAPSR